MDATQHVFQIKHPAHVVRVVSHHGDSRIPRTHKEGQGFVQALRGPDADHVDARHHHFAHQSAPHLENRTDDFPVGFFDGIRFTQLIHHLAQFLGGFVAGLLLGLG